MPRVEGEASASTSLIRNVSLLSLICLSIGFPDPDLRDVNAYMNEEYLDQVDGPFESSPSDYSDLSGHLLWLPDIPVCTSASCAFRSLSLVSDGDGFHVPPSI